MTVYAAAEQMLKYIRHGFAQSKPYEKTYYLTTEVGHATGGWVGRYRLVNTLEDQLLVVGLMLPWIIGPLIPNAQLSRDFSFNFQIEGSNEWFFSNELDVRALVCAFLPALDFSMPYVFPRPFILNSNQAIILVATDLTLVQFAYDVQACFVCIKTGYPRKEA